MILRDFSLDISPGQRVGIVGRTGKWSMGWRILGGWGTRSNMIVVCACVYVYQGALIHPIPLNGIIRVIP